MCGIFGQFTFGRRDHVAVDRLLAHTEAVRHRGPDAGGWWHDGPFFFGHRRLSIIDLSGGQQPMASADGRFVVTFNGEIYNYIELRDELRGRGHHFETESDTEVLLHGYREWGTGLPARLRGMFAFALADRVEQQLFVARDRFGEKPLLYAERSGSVVFASEMRPLTALSEVDRTLDETALASFMCLNYVPDEATLVKSIRRVAPATWRLYGRAGLTAARRYWSPLPNPAAAPASDVEAAEQVEALLDRSTRMALRSDVPVGVFLSSGIDSSLVAMSALRSGRLSKAFCLTMPDRSYSEWEGASRVARTLGIPIEPVALAPEALCDFLQVVEHADDPLADSSALAVYVLSKAASRHNKVVIGGDGGDELFGGYLTYKATAWHRSAISPLPAFVRRAIASAAGHVPVRETKVSGSYKLWRFLRAADLPSAVAHFTWNGTWLPRQAAEFMRSAHGKAAASRALDDMARRHGLPASPTLADLQRADLGDYLPNDILAKADRMSMAHGLEVRSPFLDADLAEFALSLPASMKCGRTGPTKRILRVLARKRYGERRARASKQGFSIPVHAWLRGPARDLVIDLLSPASVATLDLIDASAVSRAVDAHLSGARSYGFELWGLMVLMAWYRCRIVAPPRMTGQALQRIDVPCPALAR
jgi:asparagine synthase (glutamine-hydrolysing)